MTHPTSMVMTRIGGRDYPMRSVPQCKTCQSPYRQQAENLMLTAGRGFTSVARALPEDANLTAENLSHHFNSGHMPLPVESQIRLRERRAQEIGKKIEDAADLFVDQVMVADLIIQKGYEQLTANELEITTSDVLNAAKFRAQIEREMGQGVDTEAWVSAFLETLSGCEQIMTPDQWQAFGAWMRSNPVIAAVVKKHQESQEPSAIPA